MPIYDRPTKILMREFAAAELVAGQLFDKSQAVAWFRSHYPKIRPGTVQAHVESMSVNSALRRHHPTIKPGSGYDFFFKVGRGQYRLWDEKVDPRPQYGDEAGIPSEAVISAQDEAADFDDPNEMSERVTAEFAFERDLRNYLEKNLSALEPGLRLFEDEGLTGVEFPAGTRRIDILAVAADGAFVVVELKVSRGYDRVIGQIMRYMAWVKANMADDKSVRGIIVASEISDDLKLAATLLPDVRLVEYELAFKLKPVS